MLTTDRSILYAGSDKFSVTFVRDFIDTAGGVDTFEQLMNGVNLEDQRSNAEGSEETIVPSESPDFFDHLRCQSN